MRAIDRWVLLLMLGIGTALIAILATAAALLLGLWGWAIFFAAFGVGGSIGLYGQAERAWEAALKERYLEA